MRLFDLNPFIDIGIAPEQSLIADTLLLMCLLRTSPPITAREQGENDENKHRVVTRGRQPGLQLLVHNREQPLRALAHELFDDMAPFAAMLDSAYGSTSHTMALEQLRRRIDHPELTPSAQVIEAIREHGSYFDFAYEMSQAHTRSLQNQSLDGATQVLFSSSVSASLREQKQRDEADAALAQPFKDFVAGYYATS